MEHRQLDFEDSRKDAAARLDFIKNNPHPISLILDGLTNQRNLASIFRIAEAARVKAIYGYNLPMIDNNIKLRRISRNTFDMLRFNILNSPEELLEIASDKEIVALEITNKSIPYYEYSPTKECFLIIGSEKNGVSPELLELAKTSVHIPMHGLNTSMNVAVATGIATFGILEKLLK